ncbi:efflux RND transporter periplasmic adaptor subunit [Bradyrhizobium sp. Arg68]|uniref:efflux RND transporter periplasmic adaptor subunit n=1 Tax=Bradyrhizobium ivorense TaxID=2511166 RepID=UPI001E57BF87|nr:efflux RND transporter periplasmic adaptor subunit [Bradyrhizobium ivorense]MCC8937471.1 efflux RND transporter periplasmic adaptor subunit [Bradyrhizobium ivorense]
MNRLGQAGAVAAIVAATGVAIIGRGLPTRSIANVAASTAQAAETGAPIYFRDPDGKPLYSLTPKQTPDGRDYRPVPAGADVSFDAPEPPMEMQASAPKADRKIKYYRNPMGLPDTSPVPKKDSMGMDYIAVYDGDDSDDGSITLSPGKVQRTGVTSEPAERRRIRTLARAPGTIQLDERRVSVIAMRAESYVQKVADVTTGSRVSKGQPLMEIYSPAVSSAAAEYLATITSKATAGLEPYGRGSRQRLMNLDVPEPVIAEMEKSRTVPIAIQWSSPRDGIVLQRNAIEGMRAQSGDVLFRVADVSLVWAVIDVAERDLGTIAVGQPVTVRARSYPGRAFEGRIGVIYPQLNRETRTARIRIELANADLALLPDMYVDAEIDTGSREPVVAVAESAVLDTGSRQTVLIDKGRGRFEPREVKLGRRGEGYVEIRDGLAGGEAVVTSANFLIDAESNLKAALKGFAEPAGARPADVSGDATMEAKP